VIEQKGGVDTAEHHRNMPFVYEVHSNFLPNVRCKAMCLAGVVVACARNLGMGYGKLTMVIFLFNLIQLPY
jgi:hypothetical protein